MNTTNLGFERLDWKQMFSLCFCDHRGDKICVSWGRKRELVRKSSQVNLLCGYLRKGSESGYILSVFTTSQRAGKHLERTDHLQTSAFLSCLECGRQKLVTHHFP